MTVAPLQLKINNSYNEINTFENNNRAMLIYMMIKNFLKNVEKYGMRLLN